MSRKEQGVTITRETFETAILSHLLTPNSEKISLSQTQKRHIPRILLPGINHCIVDLLLGRVPTAYFQNRKEIYMYCDPNKSTGKDVQVLHTNGDMSVLYSQQSFQWSVHSL